MDVLKKLTGAPRSFLYKGIRYELSPLGLMELAQAKSFVKRHIMQQAKTDSEMLSQVGAPAEHIQALWKEALDACKKPLESSFMQDAEVMAEFTVLSLRRKHPTITLALVQDMFSDTQVIEEIVASTRELNSVENDVKNS